MGNLKVISLVGLGVFALILSGCASSFLKTAEEACGPFPNQNLDFLQETLPKDGIGGLIIKALEGQPIEYTKCRADHGDRYAALVYGRALIVGEAVARDYKTAAKLFKFAGMPDNGLTPIYIAGFGNVSAQTQMVKTRKATAGVTEAQYELGQLYLEGLGVSQSDRKAKKWLKRATNQGHQGAAELLVQIENEKSG